MDKEPQETPAAGDTKKSIDLDKILLPTKEVHTPDSAQRVNAGALLEQEQNATLMPTQPAAAPAVAVVPTPKKDGPLVQPLETYKSDIERLVQDKNVSVLSIAAAEAERRGQAGSGAAEGGETAPKKSPWLSVGRLAMLLGGIVLLCAAGALVYVVVRPAASAAPITVAPQAPFILVDDTKAITITAGENPSDIMASLVAAKNAVALSLGLMSRVVPEEASTTASGQTVLVPLDAQTFLQLLAPHIPADLSRTIEPAYLLGIHVYDGNQPFLMLKVDSYEQAYSGMLEWEPTMQQDLEPLFSYTPPIHLPTQNISTSTAASSSQQIIPTGFVDDIVENHDARVIQDSYGNILFLWTFLDRNTLVMTTNDATLREIIARVQAAPITPIPGQ